MQLFFFLLFYLSLLYPKRTCKVLVNVLTFGEIFQVSPEGTAKCTKSTQGP